MRLLTRKLTSQSPSITVEFSIQYNLKIILLRHVSTLGPIRKISVQKIIQNWQCFRKSSICNESHKQKWVMSFPPSNFWFFFQWLFATPSNASTTFKPTISLLVKCIAIGAGNVEIDSQAGQSGHSVDNVAMFLRSYAAQALSHEDGPTTRHTHRRNP